MSTAVIVRKTCDVCGAFDDDENSEKIQTVNWSWDESTYEIELCDPCKNDKMPQELIEVSRRMSGVVRQRTRAAKKTTPSHKSPKIVYGQFPCREPGCNRVLATAQGRGKHESVAHKKG